MSTTEDLHGETRTFTTDVTHTGFNTTYTVLRVSQQRADAKKQPKQHTITSQLLEEGSGISGHVITSPLRHWTAGETPEGGVHPSSQHSSQRQHNYHTQSLNSSNFSSNSSQFKKLQFHFCFYRPKATVFIDCTSKV